MSDRGSILISTANDIGEALVEKLGGEGYAPSVWDKEYNKLGIAEVDSAPALSVLEDSSETGTARGSILLSTANAIGAMLNKKYNTDRGFKPKEWASAASKLAPLPEKSAESSPVCSIEDGADTVPIKSWEVEIAPTLTGKSAIECQKSNGGNFYNLANGRQLNLELPKGTTIYCKTESPSSYIKVYMRVKGASTSTAIFDIVASMGVRSYTLPDDIEYLTMTENNYNTLVNGGYKIMISLESDGDYTPYTAPTVNTVNLGRTIYGGTADIANGAGVDNCKKIKLNTLSWQYNDTEYSYGYFDTRYNQTDMTDNMNFVCTNYVNNEHARNALLDGEIGVYNKGNAIKRLVVRDDSCTTLEQFLTKIADYDLVYQCTTATDFTFTPITPTPETALGVNNFWADEGDSEIEYYAVPTAYTRGTASGAIANVQSARTDLPFTKVKANIAPNLTGVESVEVTKAGKNLFDKNAITENSIIGHGTGVVSSNNSYFVSDYIPVKEGATYYFTGFNYWYQSYYNANKELSEEIPPNTAKATIPTGVSYIRVSGQNSNLETAQFEVGESATEYTPYEEPTVYTADLGEPVYGGSVDLVSGEVKASYAKHTLPSTGWTYYATAGKNTFNITIPNCKNAYAICSLYPYEEHQYISQQSDKTFMFYASGDNIKISICDNDYTSASDFGEHIGGALLVFEKLLQDNFNIDGQVISPSEGVNNLWNNAGGDTDVEYFEQE